MIGSWDGSNMISFNLVVVGWCVAQPRRPIPVILLARLPDHDTAKDGHCKDILVGNQRQFGNR